ncbi:flagellar hook-associated protein FlgL [Anaeromyxobacter diazotrophicus]|uniref:Flagellar hook-associated protein FlgL n=1 Tax=Anaeromyxobacter diazotrophicus TaxID=2590199 RepID=A0A7I9VRZ4_9BACT|nr:flagellar hook-associated protein FlgL [Anaeromyxobacter diazotrophicus]GEJ59175.1 flagellar hook-associated protein FlgL [Anaeromyxobacter diazotrophicus]
MRVTDRLIFDNATRDTAQARAAAEDASRVASTGTRIHHPSDDPAAAGMIPAFQIAGARYAAIGQAAGLASDELNAADGALDSVGTALSRARELAVQFSNGTYDASQRAGGALEVSQLADHVRAILNTRFGNRYLFGGTKDDAPPFDAAGNYVGDTGVRQVEVAPGVLQQANVLVNGMGAGTTGGVLQVLGALQAALTANDPTAVSATLDGLAAGTDAVANTRAQVGASMHAFDTAVTASKVASDGETGEASKLGQVDLVDASIQLQATQTALQASLAATAKSFQLSLVDYLK